jgi:WD40 repeat protein
MLGAMKLDGETFQRLQEELLAAFPTRSDLTQMVRVGLGENLEAITAPGTLRSTIFELIRWAEARSRLDDLLAAFAAAKAGKLAGVGAVAPFHVPFARNKSFVGREGDLARLHELLGQGGAVGVGPAALTGMGGIGKTQLAVEYAYRYQREYPGGVYWVNAAQSWQAELAGLAERVGLREDDAPERERERRLARGFGEWLARQDRALLVFDNVEDPLELGNAKLDVVPAQLAGRLLFTTRRREMPYPTLDLGVLEEADALALLLGSPGRRGVLERRQGEEWAAAVGICRSVAGLPLAIVLAAAYLDQRPGFTLGAYLRAIEKHGALVAADAGGIDPRLLKTQHDKAVRATLAEQWEALPEAGEVRRVLQTAALLGEAAQIPRARLSLLTGLGDTPDELWRAPLDEALRELAGWSLVEAQSRDGVAWAIRLHPLVRAFAETTIAGRQTFAAACGERLGEALRDMGRLHAEVAARGVDAVLEDLRVGQGFLEGERRRRVEALSRPLDREAHCLRRWDAAREPGFLLQQVRNRCFELGIAEVQELIDARLEASGWSWLRARIQACRESEALVRTLDGHTGVVTGVAVTPDGRFAVSASDDKTLKVWDLGTGQAVRTLEGHADRVTGVAVTSDGRFAVSASEDETLKVWDLATGQAVRSLEGHTWNVTGVAVTLDGRFAVSASLDETLRVWDLATGQEVRSLEGHADRVTGVAVTSDGRFAVSASMDTTLKVWDLATGQAVHSLDGHTGAVVGVAVTSDGRFAVSASRDKTLKVWDLATGQAVRSLEGHTSVVTGVAVTSDGRFAVSASWDNALTVWDLATGQAVRSLEGHTWNVTGVAVTPDGRFAVSASMDKTLKVWDLATGQAVGTLQGHTSYVPGVAVTPDGRVVVSASEDNTLKVWDLATGQAVRSLEGHTADVNAVAVTPDGRFAVSASRDETLKVWDLATGQAVRSLEGHTSVVTGVAVTSDDRFAVSTSDDKTLKVWDLATGQAVRSLEGHTSVVTDVAVTPDGRFAVSASEDRTLKLWNLATGQPLLTLETHAPLRCCAVTPDGRTLLAGDGAGALHILDLLGPLPP